MKRAVTVSTLGALTSHLQTTTVHITTFKHSQVRMPVSNPKNDEDSADI